MNFLLFSGGRRLADARIMDNFLQDEVGIFESLRTYGRHIFRLEEHMKRFVESARTAGVEIESVRKLQDEIKSALAAYRRSQKGKKDVFMRVTLWEGRFLVMAGERGLAPSYYEEGVALRTSPVRRSLSHASPPEAKTTDYKNALLASLEPGSEGVHDWLFLDAAGYVTEVRIGNLFMVRDGVLFTPPARGILNGVTRRFVIECAASARIPVKETPLTRHDLFNADEVFLTNTSWEILPVRELDKRKIGTGAPGPLTCKLRQIFRKRAQRECRQKPSAAL